MPPEAHEQQSDDVLLKAQSKYQWQPGNQGGSPPRVESLPTTAHQYASAVAQPKSDRQRMKQLEDALREELVANEDQRACIGALKAIIG